MFWVHLWKNSVNKTCYFKIQGRLSRIKVFCESKFSLNERKMVTTEDGMSSHCFTYFINWLMDLALVKKKRQFKVLSNIPVLIILEVQWMQMYEKHIRNPPTPNTSVWHRFWKNQFASRSQGRYISPSFYIYVTPSIFLVSTDLWLIVGVFQWGRDLLLIA